MDLHALKSALKAGLVTIDFTKVNGSRRTMIATLDENHGVPPAGAETTSRVRDPNLLVVWDTEHAGWRTIKVDSIREWTDGKLDVVIDQNAPVVGGWQPNTPAPTGS